MCSNLVTASDELPPKKSFTWLHLSDWHEGQRERKGRKTLLNKLLNDVRDRKSIDRRLENIDAVIFSGDISFSGKKEEYEAAARSFIEPLKGIVGISTQFLFVPGNHDFERDKRKDIPSEWEKLISLGSTDRHDQIGNILYDKNKTGLLISPFENFYSFSKKFSCDYGDNKIVELKIFVFSGRRVGIALINTAICCGRHQIGLDFVTERQSFWDYGTLSITEHQIREAIDALEDVDVKILVMHHPLNWLHEEEHAVLEQLVLMNFDIVLHGHEHLPKFNALSSNFGEIKFVPAGSTFASRNPGDPRYINSFNYGIVDLKDFEGVIHNRRWFEEKDRWTADDRYWQDGASQFVLRSKAKLRDENRKFLFQTHKLYQPYFSKRPARRASIMLRHSPIEIGEELFLEATIRYTYDLYKGAAETFDFGTYANERILDHKNTEVRDRAFKVIRMLPMPSSSSKDENDKRKIIGTAWLDTDEIKLIYEYKILETVDGVWYFSLRRFVDELTIEIQTAPGYKYEYMSLGGLQVSSGEDLVMNHTKFEGYNCMPFQGYLIQWYREAVLR